MKMRRYFNQNKAYQLILCLVGTLVFSCSGFLDEEPISDVSDETFWSNEDDANSAIAGGYAQLRRALNSGLAYYAYGDLPTDIFTGERDLASAHNNVQELNWGIAVPAANTGEVMYLLRDFQYFYSTIRQANLCIANIPQVPADQYADYETTYNQYMGEAYFLRAFAYFYMARVWGDVPLIEDAVVDEIDLHDYERSDESIILAKAIEDCETALSMLGWDYIDENDRAVRANAGTAWALLAHIYAWKGDYENVEIATSQILDEGFYSYVSRSSYLDLFSGDSPESIFEIAQNLDNEANAASAGGISNFLLRDDYLTTQADQTLWPFDTVTLRQTLFSDENDLRRTEGFWEFSDDYPVLLKYSNITYTSSDYALGMNNIVVFRLAGIVLLQAEALAAQGKYAAARSILDEIRALNGLEASTAVESELFEAIIEERGRELFMEGHRFFDLIRLAREKGVYLFGSGGSEKISESEFMEGKYYWPIQPSIIETNPLFVQTEYWRSEME